MTDYKKTKSDLMEFQRACFDNEKQQEYAVKRYLKHSQVKGSLVSSNILKAIQGEGPIHQMTLQEREKNKPLMSALEKMATTLKDSIDPRSPFQMWALQSKYHKALKAFSSCLIQALDAAPYHEWEPHPKQQLEEAIKNLESNPRSMKYFIEKNPKIRDLYNENLQLLMDSHNAYQKVRAASLNPLIFSCIRFIPKKSSTIAQPSCVVSSALSM